MAEDNAPGRTPSRHELYLESLAEANANGNQPEEQEERSERELPAPYAVEGNDTSAFVGVSPEYRTYSGEFRHPYQAEEGPTAEAEAEAAERQLPLQQPNRTPHPSTPLGVAGPREAGSASVPAEEDENTETARENGDSDTPQLPPVPSSTRRGSHSTSDDEEN